MTDSDQGSEPVDVDRQTEHGPATDRELTGDQRRAERRIASALSMPVLAAGLIGGGAVALSGAGPAPQTALASSASMAVATAAPAVATAQLFTPSAPAGHRWFSASPAATTPVEPARFDAAPFTPAAAYPTSL